NGQQARSVGCTRQPLNFQACDTARDSQVESDTRICQPKYALPGIIDEAVTLCEVLCVAVRNIEVIRAPSSVPIHRECNEPYPRYQSCREQRGGAPFGADPIRVARRSTDT